MNFKRSNWCLLTATDCLYMTLFDQFHLAAAGPGAGPAVPELHDVNSRLMPPVKHQHHQHVPHLVAGAQVVQLAWERKGETNALNNARIYLCSFSCIIYNLREWKYTSGGIEDVYMISLCWYLIFTALCPLGHLNRRVPSLVSLVTPVLLLLWQRV